MVPDGICNAPVELNAESAVAVSAPVIATVEPFHVKLAEPPSTPLLLNCTCVLDPPIEPVALEAKVCTVPPLSL